MIVFRYHSRKDLLTMQATKIIFSKTCVKDGQRKIEIYYMYLTTVVLCWKVYCHLSGPATQLSVKSFENLDALLTACGGGYMDIYTYKIMC